MKASASLRPRSAGRPFCLAACALLTVACSDAPLKLAEWIIAVPEGTPVREYAAVPLAERDPDAIRLTEELVIGADLSQPERAVFEPSIIVATDEGAIFVADSAMTRVQMYDGEGRYLRTLGGEGQGPGEFGSISGMTIAGDLLVIDDGRNDRWSTWTLDGEYVGDHRKTAGIAARSRSVQGLADGTLVAVSEDAGGEWGVRTISRLDLQGRERARLDEMDEPPLNIPSGDWTVNDVTAALVGLLDLATRQSHVGARSIIYVTPVDHYQVLALSADGMARWALRVASPRPAPSAKVKAELLRRARQMNETAMPSHFDWPADDDAIERIRTDGAGRLYVILKTFFEGEPPDRLPTDVYDTDGTRIAAGFMPVRWIEMTPAALPAWDYAAGEHVYGLRETASGETAAVRYRLELRR